MYVAILCNYEKYWESMMKFKTYLYIFFSFNFSLCTINEIDAIKPWHEQPFIFSFSFRLFQFQFSFLKIFWDHHHYTTLSSRYFAVSKNLLFYCNEIWFLKKQKHKFWINFQCLIFKFISFITNHRHQIPVKLLTSNKLVTFAKAVNPLVKERGRRCAHS